MVALQGEVREPLHRVDERSPLGLPAETTGGLAPGAVLGRKRGRANDGGLSVADST